MRPALRSVLAVFGAIAGILLLPGVASAHPLGNFTVNTSAGMVLTPGAVRIDYVLDMAEIPTVQAMHELDVDGDETVSDGEGSAWAADRALELLSGLSVAVDEEPVALTVSSSSLELLPGQGGLDVLRLEATFSGELESEGQLVFQDANFDGRVGWHEVTAVGADGVAIAGSTVPAASPSERLRNYPTDLLSSPLDVREATLAFEPGGVAPVSSTAAQSVDGSSRPGVVGGVFAGLVERTGPLMTLALALAFGFGALHALGPGHGKTLMAAYLVGAGGRTRQAIVVGAAVAVMHTASVLGLGLVVLTATSLVAPERVYPWLGMASGIVALALGAGLLVSRLAEWSGRSDHDHDHPHPRPMPTHGVLSWRSLAGLALAGGVLPSPTAVVVLLASVALHRVAFGLALLGAFSLGLASALVAVGVVAMRARDAVARRLSTRSARLVPVASAGAIVAMGLALTVNGAANL